MLPAVKAVDTVDVEYVRFSINEPIDTFQQELVVRYSEDTMQYEYYDKRTPSYANLIDKYTLLRKDEELLELLENPYYKIVDTLIIQDRGEYHKLTKYEVVNPPADGDGAVLFSEKYGMMARMNYGWIRREILTEWNGKPLDKALINAFLADSIAWVTKK